MTVKDLVGLYEARPDTTTSSPPPTRAKSGQARRKSLNLESTSSALTGLGPSQAPDVPAPSPARFIAHPLLRRREPSTADQDDDSVVPTPLPSHGSAAAYAPLYTEDDDEEIVKGVVDGDVTDELLSFSGRQRSMFPPEGSRMSGWVEPAAATDEDSAIELQSLLPGTTGSSQTALLPASQSRRDSLRLYHAETVSFASTGYKNPPLSSSTVTLVQPSRVLGSHTPIPLSQILARNAAPVSLPKLDEYISSLDMPKFPVTYVTSGEKGRGKDKVSDVAMFPPLERLKGTTIVDLENNSKIPPAWRNRDTIFSSLLNVALGVTGSSAIASFYSIEGLVDTLQIFALLLSTFFSHGTKPEDQLRTFFLQKVPNVLAFNFASTLLQSLILLVVFMIIAGVLLYFFMRMTAACCSVIIPEGLQSTTYLKHSWSVLLCSFVLTVIYLPLSTMAVHVLVWSDDLWVVPNPYTNTTIEVKPFGPPDEFRAPLDFCYTTTMLRNEINYSPVVVVIAIICFLALTIWYPIHLHRTIRRITPKVDHYTELGTLRSQSDMDREYQRLLSRDKNPLSFLYGGFRRGWATYESTYLFAKLTTLLLTAVISPDNCVFRNASRDKVNVARQILLLIAMLIFFGVQCVFAPFLDPVNNASEWFSRLNYVLTSAVSLAVAFNVPGQDILNGPVLYIIYVVTYGLNFIFINMSRARRWVKRLARRIDFSIDIFSPRLDLSSHSPHTKRRIWQEAITTLLLTDDHCHIPKDQRMEFKQARNDEYPPYLVGFQGSPGERHVENLKILREVGSLAYHKAVKLVSGPDYEWFRYMEETIQKHFVGPDCYWKPHGTKPRGCTKFFGNAWWIPFPPTLVIQYDDGPELVLSEVKDFEQYLEQNSSEDIVRKRQVRMALRALDGQYVRWPYDHVEYVGDRGKFCCCGKRYGAKTTIHYQAAKFELKRNGHIEWEGLDLGSGFDVQLTYAKDVQVGGNVIGLTEDYDLNQLLAHFLSLNENLVPSRLSYIEAVIHNYRHHYQKEFEWKKRTLSYRFLSEVYDHYPREPRGLSESAVEMESDPRVRKLMAGNVDVFGITYERMTAVSSSELATWWYIFWDDLWRRNWETIGAFEKYATDFNPHYPTSIAYTPLPRAALENFLTQRGLLHKKPKIFDFFHAGFLNKMYLRMNDVVFHGMDRAIIFHLGDDASELDMEEIDLQTLPRPSTLGTGGGTEYDDESIRARPAYRWEGILNDPLRKRKTHRRRFLSKLAVWFGISPLWRTGEPSKGLSLDVRLENGKYVLLESVATANGRNLGKGKGVEGKFI
ncbi:hypothetical protein L227DRAFT_614942 [Lentinus tigrinus ALCF2SS1-6]|uniref:Uncharacterized protein n=1 Tax=Lentinus tigrinus ALCF2SS1-6 TaxID=1328759 RepID=A0A5C2RXR7_9APHY|nr:hypothetical protein L227DRAFT_614942 [Lentinus tigrinus ALCF2SS1-6]